MDALKGKDCNNDICKALKTQAGKDAIACTKPQQVKEDVGVSGCKYMHLHMTEMESNLRYVGLKELPGGVPLTSA